MESSSPKTQYELPEKPPNVHCSSVNFWLTNDQKARLTQLAKSKNVSVGETVRRAIEFYLLVDVRIGLLEEQVGVLMGRRGPGLPIEPAPSPETSEPT